MSHNIWIYMLIMAGVTYIIRVLPLTLIRREIKNVYIRSFLFYVPYVTLAVMTFPAILSATGSPVSAWVAFLLGLVLAYVDGNLFRVAICSCIVVYVAEMFLRRYLMFYHQKSVLNFIKMMVILLTQMF